jgi:hypothetical protein
MQYWQSWLILIDAILRMYPCTYRTQLLSQAHSRWFSSHRGKEKVILQMAKLLLVAFVLKSQNKLNFSSKLYLMPILCLLLGKSCRLQTPFFYILESTIDQMGNLRLVPYHLIASTLFPVYTEYSHQPW